MVLQDYTPQHMLATLRTRLLVMYAQVDIALEEAARSYEKGEAVRAIAVCDGDTAIDALENEIDELCLRLMARIKPVAGDLRWMVRRDDRGVDFGLWRRIPMSALYLPLDVHVGETARALGLLGRRQNDWRAVEELTDALRAFDAEDPARYDFSLFGAGMDGYLNEQ